MMKTKVLTVLLAGSVGVAGTIATIKTINWLGSSSLNNETISISTYIDSSQEAMQKAKNIINTQQTEIANLNKINADNTNTIHSLNTVIAQLRGAANYSGMTASQKENTVITLLKDWGYSKFSISLISKAFAASQGEWPFHFAAKLPNTKQQNTNK